MPVYDFDTGEVLTEEEIKERSLRAAPERAAREALKDAFALLLLRQLRGGQEGPYLEAINHAEQALKYACESNGVDHREWSLGLAPIGGAS